MTTFTLRIKISLTLKSVKKKKTPCCSLSICGDTFTETMSTRTHFAVP